MPIQLRQPLMEMNYMSSWSDRSIGSSLREIEVEAAEAPARPEEYEENVYLAVTKEFEESKSTLLWTLQNIDREEKLVLVHVHRPSQTIPMMGAWFHANELDEQQVRSYRERETEKMHKSLNEFLPICLEAEVQAEILVIEMDDVGKGLVELIAQHRITKLVMGAAADKHYSKKMRVPKSKTAIMVQLQADPACDIWFVCKGNLICTRKYSNNLDFWEGILRSPQGSDSSWSTSNEALSNVGSLSTSEDEESKDGQSRLISVQNNLDILEGISRRPQGSDSSSWSTGYEVLSNVGLLSMSKDVESEEGQSRLRSVQINRDNFEGISWSSLCLVSSSSSTSDEVLSNMGLLPMPKDEESEERSVLLHSVHESEEHLQFSDLEDLEVDVVYAKLQQALVEVENLKRQANEESLRRQEAERDVVKAVQKAEALEVLYIRETKQRKDIEETLAKEKLELEELKNQLEEVFEELQITDSDRIVKDFEEKISEGRFLLHSILRENEELRQERDIAVKEAEEMRRKKEELSNGPINFSDFSYLELEEATQNFDDSLKIGEGGYGSVYRGFLRNTTVAIKILNTQSMQGQSEYHQEVNVLSRVRHPNLITLIGGCSEAWALIYEFLPNGSLEERLICKDNTPPLTWQIRIRITSEICSALIFLHSNKPHRVVHGDLKPDNILLDTNFVSKLGDFGICRFLVQSNTTTTLYCRTQPKGTFAYMDPEFLATGELTASSDVYSFGVIILRLLTGKPALGIIKEVQEALEKGNLHRILDVSAGEWPFVQAKQLARLGLRCCANNRRSHPDLSEVWRVLEPMVKAASSSRPSMSFRSTPEDNSHIPSYLICPIFQEIMMDPHIAADGFTYESEALKGWLDSGHDTSPMTNLKLPNSKLIPNRALRSAIQEWQQQQQP